jgi:hypothetical protein
LPAGATGFRSGPAVRICRLNQIMAEFHCLFGCGAGHADS